MNNNEWIIQDIDKDLLADFKQQTQLPETVLKVLLNRGFKDINSLKDFIYPKTEDLFNPFLFEDMHKAVTRIKQAIEDKEKILIYADRDADGVTSLAILYNTINVLGGNVVWYIPSDEGYGLSCSIVDKYKTENVKLIVTVDCGITAVKETEYANSLGMQVIITDHHEPPVDGLPNAYCVIDAKISSCKYPFKELAGCGVSFKVSQALMQTYGKYFDKKVAVVCVDGEKSSAYIITLVNDIIISKEEKLLNEINWNDYARIITNYQDLQKYISEDDMTDFVFLENFVPGSAGSLNFTAENLLAQYRKNEFYDDGRMLEFFENNVDLVTLGTIADIVPLVRENRILVRCGLEIFNKNSSKRPGLGYIFEEFLKNQKISAKLVSWYVAPMINAAGRMSKADISANLLLAEDKYNANNAFVELKKLNNERKELQNENTKQFDILLKEQCDIQNDNIFVVLAKDLQHGVTGIVAAKIMRFYGKPVILFIEDKGTDEATASCRSIDGFDMVSALERTKDLLVKFGGHSHAAGVTIKISKIEEFRKQIKKVADEMISTEMIAKKFIVDCELAPVELNKQTYNDLSVLEPFGAANSQPLFLLRGIKFEDIVIIGPNKDHLKFTVSKDNVYANAVFWSAAKYRDNFNYKDNFDILFNMDCNRDALQLMIQDIRKSEVL